MCYRYGGRSQGDEEGALEHVGRKRAGIASRSPTALEGLGGSEGWEEDGLGQQTRVAVL